MIDLRHGRYQDVLQDVECDALICDPPYSDRTHSGHKNGVSGHLGEGKDNAKRQQISYDKWTDQDVGLFVEFWESRCKGWICVMTSHDLIASYERHLDKVGRYVFAPIPCVMKGMTVRLGGDGPSSWCVWLVVARPKKKPYSNWGTLDGAYVGSPCREFIGGKPLWLMQAITRDYSKPGDLICDPCAGGATTLLAAESQGRDSVGSEMDEETFKKAQQRIDAGITRDMFVA